METEISDQKKTYPIIRDRMASAILVMFISGLLPGIIALVYSNKATYLYSLAMASDDERRRDDLYAQAVRKDKVSKTWILIGLAIPVFCILLFILAALFSK